MALFGKSENETVGIDIGTYSIKLVRLKHIDEEEKKLTGLGIRHLPKEVIADKEIRNNEVVSDNLRELVDLVDSDIERGVISLCGRKVFTDRFSLRMAEDEDIRERIMVEAEQRLPMGTEGVNIDFDIVSESGSEKTIVMIAVYEDYLNDYLMTVQAADLKVASVGTDYSSLFNIFQFNGEIMSEGAQAIVNVGKAITNIAFIIDGEYYTVRDITNGTDHLWEDVADELRLTTDDKSKLESGEMDWDDEQELKQAILKSTEELNNGIDMAFSYLENVTDGRTVDYVYLTGGGALVPYLKKALEESINMTIEVVNPFSNLSISPELSEKETTQTMAPVFSIAVGLALREL